MTIRPSPGGTLFAMLPRHLSESSMAFSLDADYDYIWREFGQKGHSLAVTPRLSYPVWLGSYLEFEPSVSYTRDIQWLDSKLKQY